MPCECSLFWAPGDLYCSLSLFCIILLCPLSNHHYRVTIGVLKIMTVIAMVILEIRVLTDSDCIGHPWARACIHKLNRSY